jgi:hypothetical protein
MKIGQLVKTANDRVTNSTRPYQTIREAALQAETDGFDSIWICDHMLYRRKRAPHRALERRRASPVTSSGVSIRQTGGHRCPRPVAIFMGPARCRARVPPTPPDSRDATSRWESGSPPV